MEHDRLARLVAQYAHSAALLGADAVPVAGADPGSPARGDPGCIGVSGCAPVSGGMSVLEAKPPAPDPGRTGTWSLGPGGPAVPMRPARDRSEAARRLEELRRRYEAEAPHRHFPTDHTTIVFGEGDPCARLMFVGEGPGAEEDRTGRPFVGPAGQLLDRMIEAMGLRREEVYIANVLKVRPPGNATPSPEAIRVCAPYLYEQVAIVSPEVIVALGLPAARALLDRTEPMSHLRGRWHTCRLPIPWCLEVPVMPTYHPAFLLRAYTPENRRKVWSDLQEVMRRLGLLPVRCGVGPGQDR